MLKTVLDLSRDESRILLFILVFTDIFVALYLFAVLVGRKRAFSGLLATLRVSGKTGCVFVMTKSVLKSSFAL